MTKKQTETEAATSMEVVPVEQTLKDGEGERPELVEAEAGAGIPQVFPAKDNWAFEKLMLTQAMCTLPRVEDGSTPASTDRMIAMARGSLTDGTTRDPVEIMARTQLFGMHNMAMNMVAGSQFKAFTGDLRTQAEYVNLAAKSTRVFARLLDSLRKYKSGGEQRMKVEHVHVNEGGQAIVGNVSKGGHTGDDGKN